MIVLVEAFVVVVALAVAGAEAEAGAAGEDEMLLPVGTTFVTVKPTGGVT